MRILHHIRATFYTKQYLQLLLITMTTVVEALRDVKVTIPHAVRIMDTVTMKCDFDLNGEPLYTVKWYKGTKEFFRYIPKEHPSSQIFLVPGINVDVSKSTPHEVVLRSVQPEITGRYRCEVSSDAPNFYTYTDSSYMYVAEISEDEPTMNHDKDSLEIGYTIRLNCTAPPSYPAANITWFLNGKKINGTSLKYTTIAAASTSQGTNPDVLSILENRRQPVNTVSKLDLEIDRDTFQAGKASLKCVVNVFSLYHREVETVLEEDRPKPRPSSVLGTRDAGSDSATSRAGFMFVMFLIFVCLR